MNITDIKGNLVGVTDLSIPHKIKITNKDIKEIKVKQEQAEKLQATHWFEYYNRTLRSIYKISMRTIVEDGELVDGEYIYTI